MRRVLACASEACVMTSGRSQEREGEKCNELSIHFDSFAVEAGFYGATG